MIHEREEFRDIDDVKERVQEFLDSNGLHINYGVGYNPAGDGYVVKLIGRRNKVAYVDIYNLHCTVDEDLLNGIRELVRA